MRAYLAARRRRAAAAIPILSASLLAASLWAAPAAAGANLIQNGDFTLASATAPADWSWTKASLWFNAGVYPGGMGAGNEALSGGNFFMFSFWLSSADTGSNGLTASVGGHTVFAARNITASTNATTDYYTEYSYSLVATAAATLISFAGFDDPAYIQLDGVSLVALGPTIAASSSASGPADVPETPSWPLALLGLTTFGLLRASALLRGEPTRAPYCRRG